jgi:hypothetical protein
VITEGIWEVVLVRDSSSAVTVSFEGLGFDGQFCYGVRLKTVVCIDKLLLTLGLYSLNRIQEESL